jgi:hypothetical protein
VAHVVAVEQVGAEPVGVQPLLHQVGDGGLAGAGQAGEPHHAGLVPAELGAGVLVDLHRLPVDVVRPTQGVADHAGAHGVVGEPVDDDEAAHVAVVVVRVEGHRLVEGEVAHADLVELEGLGRDVLERVDVHAYFRSDTEPDTVLGPSLNR